LKSVVAQPLGGGESRGFAVRHAHHAVIIGAEPECAGVVLKGPAKSQFAGRIGQPEFRGTSIGVAHDLAGDGGEPEHSVMVATDGGNVVVGESVAAVQNADHGSAHAHQAVGR